MKAAEDRIEQKKEHRLCDLILKCDDFSRFILQAIADADRLGPGRVSRTRDAQPGGQTLPVIIGPALGGIAGIDAGGADAVGKAAQAV